MTIAHDTRQVVELRIHGVNNASPQSMLDDPPAVERVESTSDDSAGFYRVPAGGAVAAGPVREAYWWGGLARLSGRWRALPVLSAIVRAGWVLLLPFGLANVAYWSRPLDNGQLGRGAVSMRLFGLGLTVLLVSTMCTITMDLYALQCWSAGELCRFALPLGGLPPASRVALASLLPMAVLAGLWLLTRASRVSYEEYPPEDPGGSGADRDPGEPETHHVLARSALWRGGAMVGGLSCLHVAAGSAVVVIASSWPALIGPGTACRTLGGLTLPGCMAQRAGLPPLQEAVFATTAALAVVVLAVVVLLVVLRTADAPDVRSTPARWTGRATSGVFSGALALYGAQFVALHAVQPALTVEGTAALPGSNAAPTLEVALLVALAVGGLTWRSRVRYLPEVCGALVGLGLLATHVSPVLAAALVAVGCVGVGLLVRRGPTEGLRRTAPGVLLGASLLVAVGLSSVAPLVAGYLLDGGASPSNLLHCGTSSAGGLCVPRVYVWGGTSVLVAGVLAGVLMAVLVVLALARPVPGGMATPAVRSSRRRAALAHRAEPVMVVLGMLGLLAAAVAVAGTAVPPGSRQFPAGLTETAEVMADSSVAALTAAAVVAMVAVVVRSLGTSSTRPLGLVWDLLCFLPRAVHPFAPPCYAERAVPELAGRIRALVREGHLVVLSAHSLGAVLAVSAYFRLDETERRAVRLLTYGAQLRPYFGRLFPDLFGPQVLGTQPCAGARLWTVDPWADDRQPAVPEPGPATLLGELGTGWLSLWRPTDYLGFPVRARAENHTDRGAEELGADGRVQTHGGYRATGAYADALARLQ